MKNEHIEFDELYRLAEIEVQGEVYSEEEKKELQHLIECEECYERYCAAALSPLPHWTESTRKRLPSWRKKVTLKRRKENLPNSESILRRQNRKMPSAVRPKPSGQGWTEEIRNR